MLWFWLALFAAISWGVGYALSERVLVHVSSAMYLAVVSLIEVFLYGAVAFFLGDAKANLYALTRADVWPSFIASLAIFFVANLAIFHAIKLHNATAVNMIEITYPLFTALAAWIIFKEAQLTPQIMAGGALILSGIAVMYLWR